MKTGLIKKKNVGTVCRNRALGKEQTIVITGLMRGGTSAIAALFRSMGVSFGDNGLTGTFEHIAISNAAKEGWSQLSDAVSEIRDSACLAIKYPRLYKHIAPKQLSQLPGLVLVGVFRDPFAIAQNYTETSALAGWTDTIGRVLQEFQKYVEWIAEVDSNLTILLSYERCVRNPVDAAKMLAAELGFSVHEEKTRKAITHSGYLLEAIK